MQSMAVDFLLWLSQGIDCMVDTGTIGKLREEMYCSGPPPKLFRLSV